MPPKLMVLGVIVKDMPTALAFYRELGLDIPIEMDKENHVDHHLDGGLSMSWDTYETMQSFDAHWQPSPEVHHKIGLAFRCDNPADVDATYQSLIDKGYRSYNAPFDAFWEQRYAQILDPDSNVVDLFANL